MKLDGRQILLSVFLVLLVNCWLSSAVHIQFGKVGTGNRNGKRTEVNIPKKIQLRQLCQTAQQRCLGINGGLNEKRVDEKEDSLDLLDNLRSLCYILELRCDSTQDNSILKRRSLRSPWQRR